ncbi:Metallo-dependent phosphatase-like protein [Fimicolochytrium jonesii]|uniref:Metallo-dependent phosphatase-like protein n=1 Tax=Fimicolochytrium jonesii TaxID=1396493 RepID=UPI0022FF2E26|nr:Metallo-dependent phosphatase-like protein [Fimicolochytrium jonesii]KAI8819829.1 Metallo-dependent phosphatase-like protein [Fimicolochytrium jonesii]
MILVAYAALALLLQTGVRGAPFTASPAHKRFVHLTDIHYDPLYVSGADTRTQCHRRTEDSQGTDKAAHYGTRGSNCDSPFPLVSEVFAAIRNDIQKDSPVDVVFLTGDSSRHDRDSLVEKEASEVYSQNAEVVYHIDKTFDLTKTTVIPSIGNWDVSPHNMLPEPKYASDAFANLYSVWRPLLESGLSESEVNSTKQTFLSGGYFDRVIGQVNGEITVRAISLNTLYFFAENTAVDDCEITENTGAVVQLSWLEEKLTHARQQNEKVVIIGHVPPIDHNDNPLYKPNCLRLFLQTIGDHAEVVLSQFYGHINKDVIYLLTRQGDESIDPRKPSTYALNAVTPKTVIDLQKQNRTILSVSQTSSSILPVHNTGVKAGVISIRPHDTHIMRESQWFIDIVRANDKFASSPGQPSVSPITFKEACKTDDDYKMQDLKPRSYQEWLKRLHDEAKLDLTLDDVELKAGKGKKPRSQILKKYGYCMDALEKQPHPPPDNHLSLSPAVVRAVLISATVVFVGLMVAFYFFVQYLEKDGDVLERQRLFFRPVESNRGRDNFTPGPSSRPRVNFRTFLSPTSG